MNRLRAATNHKGWPMLMPMRGTLIVIAGAAGVIGLMAIAGVTDRHANTGVISPNSAQAHPPVLPTPEAEKAVIEEIVAFRKRVADTIAAKDAANLRNLYTATFSHTHTSAKVDGRDARIVAALAGDPVIETASTTDLVIRIPNDWTAIATGVSPIRALSDGKVYAVRWTVVYVRTTTSWALAASHATRGDEIKP